MTEIVKLIKKSLQVFCIIIIDLFAFYTSLLIAWALRSDVIPYFIPYMPVFNLTYSHFVSLWWIPAVFIFFIFYDGLYNNNLPFWDETRDMLKSISLAIIAVMAIVTAGKMGGIVSRLVLLGMWLSSLFIFPLFRLWGKKFLYSIGFRRERVLILGAGNAGRLVMEGLRREKHMGYDVVGFLDDDEQKIGNAISGIRVFDMVKRFPELIKKLGIKIVVIAMPSLSAERLSVLTSAVQNHTPNMMLIPDLKGIALLNTKLFHLFYEEIFLMNIRNNLKSITNRFIKRSFDTLVSIISMPLLLPIIALIGTVIRTETSGPAIYAHDRIGKNGKTFRCYKFRTMHKDAEERLEEILENNKEIHDEWLKNQKLRDDPRITKVGRFLRRTSLDELPQIFNVIRGEMSLVGPRPVTKEEIQYHYKDAAEICFSVAPGITGLWQVSGRTNTGYEYRVKLDAWYIMNWSLWLDIAIIFKTIRVVIRAEGAY